MHRFSWRMADGHMRLPLQRVNVRFIVDSFYPADLFTQAVCDHTSIFPWCICPSFYLCVCRSDVCCAFTFSPSQSCHLCAHVYTACLERESSDEECFNADWALTPCCPIAPASPVLLHTLPSRIVKDKSEFISLLSTNVMFGAKPTKCLSWKLVSSLSRLYINPSPCAVCTC